MLIEAFGTCGGGKGGRKISQLSAKLGPYYYQLTKDLSMPCAQHTITMIHSRARSELIFYKAENYLSPIEMVMLRKESNATNQKHEFLILVEISLHDVSIHNRDQYQARDSLNKHPFFKRDHAKLIMHIYETGIQ